MAGRWSALDPFGSSTDPFGSKPDLNGTQTGLSPELSKQTPPDPIRTWTDYAPDFQVQSDLPQVRSGPIQSVLEHWMSLLDFKMKFRAECVFDSYKDDWRGLFCSQRTLFFSLSLIVRLGPDRAQSRVIESAQKS